MMKFAKPIYAYQVEKISFSQWVEILVNCVYAEGLYTYKTKPDTLIKVGWALPTILGCSLPI